MKPRGLALRTLALAALASTAFAAHAAKTLVYCSEGSPEGFNPQYYTTGTTFDAVSVPLYNRLVEFEIGTTNVVPALAESWTAAFPTRSRCAAASRSTRRPSSRRRAT